MNKDKALRLALEALRFALHVGFDVSSETQIKKGDKAWQQHQQAITAIKEALETKEGLLDRNSYLLGLYDQKSRIGLETKDKPVAWMLEQWGPDCGPYIEFYRDDEMGWRDRKEFTPLYTTPQRTWVGLDTDEFKFIASKYLLNREAGLGYFQEEIEAKLKEKNNAT